MSSETFITWLYESSLSALIRDVFWIVPTVQCIHILAIAVIVGSALVSDLRLAGMLATDEPLAEVVRHYFPWMWRALVVLLLTGLVMGIGEPDRVLTNTTFWLKMALVATAFSLTWLTRRPLLSPDAAGGGARWTRFVKPCAWLSLLLWICVIVCGRWIAYAI
ncbi:DUF6644 family protein [Burkholderia sp. LMU1-1-1.1]|uniref:DUF6644 family protein n=1 Tax=Burkholderia sp. LMU1-1-1.1 TaxID=3135266 RepID=UPI003419D374